MGGSLGMMVGKGGGWWKGRGLGEGAEVRGREGVEGRGGSLERLERFFILQYSKTCGQTRVNKARSYLFQTSARSLDRMPPTQAALYQHIRRALQQAGHIWAQALVLQPVLPHSLIGDGREVQSVTWYHFGLC